MEESTKLAVLGNLSEGLGAWGRRCRDPDGYSSRKASTGFTRVARRAGALGMRLAANDPYLHEEHPAWRELGVERVGLNRLLAESDAVTLHVPLTDETRRLIDAKALARMKPDAVLVNTTRGGVVDEAALIDALKAGRLAGAMVDVFAEEPLSAESGARFENVPNLILTPHIAGITWTSHRWISVFTVNNVLEVLAGGG